VLYKAVRFGYNSSQASWPIPGYKQAIWTGNEGSAGQMDRRRPMDLPEIYDLQGDEQD